MLCWFELNPRETPTEKTHRDGVKMTFRTLSRPQGLEEPCVVLVRAESTRDADKKKRIGMP